MSANTVKNKEPNLLYGLQLYNNVDEKNLLYILAYIIDNCNYACSYCYNHKPYTMVQLDLNYLYNYIVFVKEQYPTKFIQLEIIGGEPTLHPNLLAFCEKTKLFDNLVIKIFTNLSATLKTYKSLLDNKNVILIASWHSLQSDMINSHFLTIATELLQTNKNQIEVRIMYEIFNSDNAIAVAEKLLPYANNEMFDLSFIFDNVAQANTKVKYSKEQITLFNDFHNKHQVRSNRKEFIIQYTDYTRDIMTFTDMFCNKDYSFKHWLCNAGKNSLFIDYDGLTYPCVEYSYDKNNKIFNLYNNVSYNDYKFRPILCKLDYCTCDWDIKKQKIFK